MLGPSASCSAREYGDDTGITWITWSSESNAIAIPTALRAARIASGDPSVASKTFFNSLFIHHSSTSSYIRASSVSINLASRPDDPFSTSSTFRVVGTTASGLRLMESMPRSTRKAAKSG